ncbi:hypothetical protein ACJX0J_037042, partial [Zea mays]
ASLNRDLIIDDGSSEDKPHRRIHHKHRRKDHCRAIGTLGGMENLLTGSILLILASLRSSLLPEVFFVGLEKDLVEQMLYDNVVLFCFTEGN